MENKKFKFKCIKCNQLSETENFCDCGNKYYSFKTLEYDYEKIGKNGIDFWDCSKGFEKYLPLLPCKEINLTLGEGNTPLLKLNNYGKKSGYNNLYLKDETTNPTGSFKDRETAIITNYAKEKGYDKFLITSSGNAAVSAAAYSNIAGITCDCYVPEDTSSGKKHLLSIFGAKLITQPGEYEEIYRRLIDEEVLDDMTWNITSGINVFKEEGNKIIAFEIFREIGIPDKVVAPIGNGGLFAGLYKGFCELKKIGVTDKIPQMIGVQIKEYSPIAKAMEAGEDFSIIEEEPDSIAEAGIAAQESYCSPLVIQAITESGGKLIQIVDEDLIQALNDLLKYESFLAEPTSFAPFAALGKMESSADEKVVCVGTGNAYKNLPEIFSLLGKK